MVRNACELRCQRLTLATYCTISIGSLGIDHFLSLAQLAHFSHTPKFINRKSRLLLILPLGRCFLGVVKNTIFTILGTTLGLTLKTLKRCLLKGFGHCGPKLEGHEPVNCKPELLQASLNTGVARAHAHPCVCICAMPVNRPSQADSVPTG